MRKPNGFTLIELIVSISVMAVLSTLGIASYVNYSRTQAMNTAAYDVTTMLNKAKSRAMSQAIQDKNNQNMCGTTSVFTGYAVLICDGVICTSGNENSYELDIVCKDKESTVNNYNHIESGKLPSKITFDNDGTTLKSFLFRSLVGGVEGADRTTKITINGYGNTKVINVDSAGNISIK